MSNDPYKRIPTKPLPRAEIAPAEAAPISGNEPTLVQCPLCAGAGMVEPEIAVAFEEELRITKDRQG